MLGPEGEGQIGLLARKPWYDSASAASPAAETLLQIPAEKSWLIFADASGVGEGLASQLRGAGVRCRVARRGDHFAQDGSDTFTLRAEVLGDWKQLLHECAKDAPPERFVYLWSLDEPRTDATGDAAATCVPRAWASRHSAFRAFHSTDLRHRRSADRSEGRGNEFPRRP